MIVHFFNGINFHLSYRNIKSYISRHRDFEVNDQIFLIYANNISEVNRLEYAKLFVGLDYLSCIFWNNYEDISYLFKNLKSTDRIIFHSSVLSYRLKFQIYIKLFFINMLKNSILVCWNFSDAYSDSVSCKSKVYNWVNNFFQSKFKSVCLITPGDKIMYDSLYKNNNSILLPLLSSHTPHPLRYNKQVDGRVTVMVSHSGWPHNNHDKSFSFLKRIDNGNLLVFCPLCYGDSNYIEHVVTIGKSLFGDRFNYITELMPYEDYKNYLNNNIDIYLTSADLQSGLGASNILLRGGAKIYVGDNLYKSYKLIGVNVHSTSECEYINYDQFVKEDNDQQYYENMKNITSFYDSDRILSQYKSILKD